MLKIRNFCFRRFRNGEHFQVHFDIVFLLKDKIMVYAMLIEYWNEYLEIFNIEEEIFQSHLEADETLEIGRLNALRNVLSRKLNVGVDAGMLSDDPEVRASAEMAQHVLKNYKYIYLKPYMENTALTDKTVDDCRNPQYAPHIARLGLTSTVDEVADVNKKFDNLYVKRSLALYDKKKLGKMVTIRPKVDAKLKTLVNGINVLYAYNELGEKDPAMHESLTEIINAINACINQAEIVYHRRAGKLKVES
jgi:hypothetical protein